MATSRKYRRVLSHDDDEADDDDHNAAQQLRTENDDSGGGDNGGDDSRSSSGGARRQRTATTSRPASASVSASPSAAVAVAADTRRATPPERLDISLAPVAPASPGRRAASSLVATFSYTEPTYSEDDVRLELGRVSNVRKFRSDVSVWVDNFHVHVAVMVLLILDVLLVLLDVALGNGSLVAYILTLPVMIALCMETGLRAVALGSVLWSAPYLAAAELGITWLAAGLFFGLPQVGRLVLLGRILLHVPTLRTAWLQRGEPMSVRQLDAAGHQEHLLENTDDLDLAPITPHIVVMPYPGLDRFGRRILSIDEVAAFLDRTYLDGYRIFNVSANSAYSAAAFHGRVVRFPVADGDTATLHALVAAAQALDQWLRDNPKSVALVHCDTGMGRACQLVAAYLLVSRLSPSAHDALSMVSNRRTARLPARWVAGQREAPFSGTDVPSQERFLQYLEMAIPTLATEPLPTATKRVMRIEVRGLAVPASITDRRTLLAVDVYSEGNKVYSSSDFQNQWADDDGTLVLATEQLAKYGVKDDVKIVFRSAAITVTVPAPGDALFHAWVHMGYAPSNGRWVFNRADLDYAHMPANTGAVGSGLEVTLQVADVQ